MIYKPENGRAAMADLAATLAAPELRERPLIIAGFSVGAYLFGHLQARERSDDVLVSL